MGLAPSMSKYVVYNWLRKFRDVLLRNYNVGEYFIEVSLDDLKAFDDELEGKMRHQPAVYLALV